MSDDENGFKYKSKKTQNDDVAFLALNSGLQAYFSTYQPFKFLLHIFAPEHVSKEDLEFYHPDAYCERYFQVIVHFHQFAELLCKRFLREDHPLLATDNNANHLALHKALHKMVLPADEGNSIGFFRSLERLNTLVKKKMLKNHDQLFFFVEHEKALIELNDLRNRILHRGRFILFYHELDKFICGQILPFINSVLNHNAYKNAMILGKCNTLSCKINPIEYLMDETKHNYKIERLALLKELGRAAFMNLHQGASNIDTPETIYEINDWQIRREAEKVALLSGAPVIEKCPVCGLDTLIVCFADHEEIDSSSGQILGTQSFAQSIKCTNCTFSINNNVEIPGNTDFSAIKNYWEIPRKIFQGSSK